MFQMFARGKSGSPFRSRSLDRDLEVDSDRLAGIANAIDAALASARSEHDGLRQRLDDVLARTAVTIGSGSDEYLDREPADTQLQNELGTQISNAENRLLDLKTSIGHFKFLKTALKTRFPSHPLGDETKQD